MFVAGPTVVVDDRALALARRAIVAPLAPLRLTKKVSFALDLRVALDVDGDRLARLPGGERQRAAGDGVVAFAGGAVLRGPVDGAGAARVAGAGDGEVERRRAAVAFVRRHVVDRQRRRRGADAVVVLDRADAGRVGDRRAAGGVAQRDVERLVGLVGGVAVDVDRDLLARLARGEGNDDGAGAVVVVGVVGGLVERRNIARSPAPSRCRRG